MESALRKILDLVKQTGDRCLVTDPDGQNVFVMISIEEYKRLRGLGGKVAESEVTALTEEQLLNRINREIADWKSGQEPGKETESSVFQAESNPVLAEDVVSQALVSKSQEQSIEPQENEERFYFEPVDEAK